MLTLPARSSFHGALRVPGDKSGSHRAVLLSALAGGACTIEGLSPGEDVRGTAALVAALGATISTEGVIVHVQGPSGGLRATSEPLDCGNSGTTMRLCSGLLAPIVGHHTLIGDASLMRRPMDRVAIPLRLMGGDIRGVGEREVAPLSITGRPLTGIEYDLPVPSAQVKSALLLAGLFASGATIVRERHRTRTTTEVMLAAMGAAITSVDEGEGRVVTLAPGLPQGSFNFVVPGDPSQAAFFAVLGLLGHDSSVAIIDVDTAPERIGFAAVLQRMGGELTFDSTAPRATITTRSSQLVATEIWSHEIPSVDEAPILAIAAAAAEGVTAFRDMGELRVKESDRFAGCLAMAAAVGARTWSDGDDFFIEGLGHAGAFQPFTIDAGLDHRIVMSSAIAGVVGQGCTIEGHETVASSYPHFFDDLASLS